MPTLSKADQKVRETITQATLRKESALATLREIELSEKQGKLIEVDAAATLWASVGQIIRDGLLSLPERIAPELAALTDQRQVRDQLRDELRKVLANFPDAIHKAVA